MKKITLLIILSLIGAIESQAQHSFRKGYFIDTNGKKIECHIKKISQRNSPEQLEFIVQEERKYGIYSARDADGFGFDEGDRYVSAIVDLDQSSTVSRLNSVSIQRNPIYKRDTVFLKCLVDGDASLYLYQQRGHRLFFFNLDGQDIEPLVHKLYRISTDKGSKMKVNRRFQQQLATALECAYMKAVRFEDLEYIQSELERLFLRYNQCTANNE